MMYVYPTPERTRLTRTDINGFLGLHLERHGQATHGTLHPRNRDLAEILERAGVSVSYLLGCLGWELRLSTGCVPDAPSLPSDGAVQAIEAASQVSEESTYSLNFESPFSSRDNGSRRGRRRISGKDVEIKALASKGLSTRAIASELGLSQPTVVRRLQEQAVKHPCKREWVNPHKHTWYWFRLPSR